MGNSRILIVDDEESVLKVLRDSLTKQDAEYEIVTATSGERALEEISEDSFDLVVTDYKMTGTDGLELLESIRSVQPDTRVILMTAYGTDAVEAEARRLQAYEYLAKPLKIGAFRRIVDEALGNIAISRPGFLILSEDRFRQVIELLRDLASDVGARCAFLADGDGHIIAQAGNAGDLPLEQIASLLGGGIATLIEAGKALDEDSDSIHLAYREAMHDCLYAISVGEQLLLVIVITNTPYASRIGTVWFCGQQSVEAIREVLGDADFATPQEVFTEVTTGDLENEFDTLFKQARKGGPANPTAPVGEIPPVSSKESRTFSYEEALSAGLIDDLDDQRETDARS